MNLISLLIYLVIIGVVFYLIDWLLGQIPLPPPVRVVVRVIMALVLVLISKGASLPMLFVAPALATGIGAVVALLVVRRRFGVRLEIDRSRVGYLMKEALPSTLMSKLCTLNR